MVKGILAAFIFLCISLAVYIHTRRKYYTGFWRESLFWIAVLATVAGLIIELFF